MRVHKVVGYQDDLIVCTRYAATAALAKEERDAMMEKFNLPKRKIEIEQTEIPTDKPSLLEFINELCAETDASTDEEEETSGGNGLDPDADQD